MKGAVRRSTTLPQFRASAVDAVEAAVRAEEEGLDGVFVYDHVYPLGRPPGAPAAECLTLLATLAVATTRVRVGTLVLRAGLRPTSMALDALRTVVDIAPGRLVVGIGTGDKLNAEENLRLGIPYGTAAERLDEVRHLAEALAGDGIEVWIGGRGRRVRELCAELGLVWNCWGATAEELAAELADVPQGRVTWGGLEDPGPLPDVVEEVVLAPPKEPSG